MGNSLLDDARHFLRKRRASPEIKDKIDARVADINRQIVLCEAIASLEKHPGWLAVQEDVSDKLKSVSNMMDRQDIPDIALRVNNITRISLKGFLNYVENAKAALESHYAALAVAKKEYERYDFE